MSFKLWQADLNLGRWASGGSLVEESLTQNPHIEGSNPAAGTTRELMKRRHDTQHNDIRRNDTQHNGLVCDTPHKWHPA